MRTTRATALIALYTLLIFLIIYVALIALTDFRAEFQDYFNVLLWTFIITAVYAGSPGLPTHYSISNDKYSGLLEELMEAGFEEYKRKGKSLWLISKGRNIFMDYLVKIEQRDYYLKVKATSRERRLLDKYIGLDGSESNG